MNKIILFDLDGTLIDSTDAIVDTFFYVFNKRDIEHSHTRDYIKQHIGYPLDVMFHNLGMPKEICLDLTDDYREQYRKVSIAQTELLPTAMSSLELASKYARLGIVTTKNAKFSKPLLESLGIYNFFEAIIGRDSVTNPKPHPEPIFRALKDMNHDDEEVWMIGDTKLDLIAANDARVKSVGVLTGYDEKETLEEYTNNITECAHKAVELIINGTSKNY
jgi:phosphoglycolate phosphatase